jgi:prepilin-type N-terminal cleavage/methylation domain-containing protein
MTRREDGFTLVELLISVSLMLVVMGAAFAALQSFEGTSARNTKQNDAQDRARNAIDLIVKRLRNDASPTPGSPQAIDRATPTDLIFQTVDPVDPPAGSLNSHNIMRVRYCLDASTPSNERLYMQQQRWTSAVAPGAPAATICPETSGAWQTEQVLTDHLTNDVNVTPRPVWTFDCPAGYSVAVCDAGTDQQMLSQVSRMGVTLYVDDDPTKAPAESRLSSAVFFRNQNAAPTATMSQPTVAAGHVYANGGASSDPDADRLYYRWCWYGANAPAAGASWCSGGTELPERSMSLDYDGSAFHGTGWVGLRVQDTGGLVSYDTKSVVLP